MHKDTIFQSILTVCAKYYEHWTKSETTAPHTWHIFEIYFRMTDEGQAYI